MLGSPGLPKNEGEAERRKISQFPPFLASLNSAFPAVFLSLQCHYFFPENNWNGETWIVSCLWKNSGFFFGFSGLEATKTGKKGIFFCLLPQFSGQIPSRKNSPKIFRWKNDGRGEEINGIKRFLLGNSVEKNGNLLQEPPLSAGGNPAEAELWEHFLWENIPENLSENLGI